jgi:CheY-like chemotaxis protein
MPHHISTPVSEILTTTPFVILIDDDGDDIEMLSISLEQHGIKTKSFDSGENALFYLKLISEVEQLPNLIILDYNMPRINGQQLLILIKNTMSIKHIPVIMYSTSISTVLEKALIELNAYDCITKAGTQKEFIKHVEKFKELAYLFHSKHELLVDLLKFMDMKTLNRKLVLDTMIKHETLTVEDVGKRENLGLVPDKVQLGYLLKELVEEGFLTMLDGALTPTYTITDKGIEKAKKLKEEELQSR